jgi:alcohol dehydrogenase class IV
MPAKITAGSGMDALSHAIEGVLSSFATPLTQSIALEAIRLISDNVRVAYHKGRDIEARYNMSLAATMAGLSFNDPGVVHGHSIAQTFSPLYGIPHGLSCAMTLPYIMTFYRPVCPNRLAQIATAMDVDNIGLSESEAAEAAIIEVHKLNEDLDIPSLREVGVEKEKLPEIARDCVKYWVRANSPRQLTENAALQILEDMWSEI